MTNRILAPAKLNLGLKITGRRSDGYHFLKSLFIPIDIYDELTIEGGSFAYDRIAYFAGSPTASSSGYHSPVSYSNDTISKTLYELRKRIPTLPFFSVKVIKGIPAGSGLGGGSSDAATVLKFAADFLNISPPGNRAFAEAAQATGADVSFFLQSSPAYVTGVGEEVEPIRVEPIYFAVCIPPFSVSTKEVYGWFDTDYKLTQAAPNASSRGLNEVSREVGLQEIVRNLDNDLEKVVEARHPEISVVKNALLKSGALGSQMSGSGSSIFGVFQTLAQAEAARKKLKSGFPEQYKFFACKKLG